VLRRLADAFVVIAIMATVAIATRGAAQAQRGSISVSPTPGTRRPARGEALTIHHLVMGPGDAVWERFGHNAIWVHDAARGTDVVYNWGMFDFDQPNFVGRFLTGDTKYWMAGFDLQSTIADYAGANRPVWAQELNLTPAQREALRSYLEWNARPENMYYRYDYYRDNCSTRVRDAIDRVVGGRVRAETADELTTSTYRSHTERLTASSFPVYTGIMLALGHPADRPLSVWEEMFLPMEMREHLRTVRVPDETGTLVPLVRAERQLFAASRPPAPVRPPERTALYLAIGAGVAALVVMLAVGAARGSAAARLGLALVAAGWELVVGLLGTGLVLAWTVTQHVFMARNENLFHFNPLALLLAMLVPVALYRPGVRGAACALAYAIAAISVAGLLVKALPIFDQQNWELIALALPAHLGMAWAVRHATQARVAAPAVARAAA